MKFKDAVVLVTGSNRGLGRALVQECLRAGAKRVYAGARDPRRLAAAFEGAGHDKVIPIDLDITNAASLEAAAARANDVTMLFNNAGVLASFGILASPTANIEQDFATNFFGTIAATKAFLPALERAAPGALVNILSVASLANAPALAGYSAAKAAAFSATQGLRAELASKGISVHAVMPGTIDTDMVRDFKLPKTSPESVARSIIEGVEEGLDDILPDPASRQMYALWQTDPKALERQLASLQT